jgi:gluconokinase
MIVIVMGVSGCGKTTVGELLAERLGCDFSDADDFHPAANVEKMRAGSPLSDDDRRPWLQTLRRAIEGWQAAGESRVIACSALKAAYRDLLSPQGDAIFVFLTGSSETIAARLEARKGHYMNPGLLASQLATLEEPADAIAVNIAPPPAAIADKIMARLDARGLHQEKRRT